jgi:glucose-6-phosphate isomerase
MAISKSHIITDLRTDLRTDLMTDLRTDLLTDSPSFITLEKTFTPTLSSTLTTPPISNGPLTLHYGLTPLSPSLLPAFQSIIEERHIAQKYHLILNETRWNTTENQAICHHHCRHPSPPQWVSEEHAKWTHFYTSTKNQFTDIVQIGIGGSCLGPKALIHALHHHYTQHATPHFISSIDPFEINQTLNKLTLSSTLFIVVSKSGKTTETCHIWNTIKDIWSAKGLSKNKLVQHSISITCPNTPLDDPDQFQKRFYIQSSIGGRFSVTSAVGGVITSLIYGSACFKDFLAGAYQFDQHTEQPSIKKNMALLNACLTITYRNLCHYPAIAIIPYSAALHYLPHHLQQLICESNGKQVSKNGHPLPYSTNPAIMIGTGTDAQHSTFQQFHQGSDIIPVSFIGITKNSDLNDHITAQAIALHQENRPSSILMMKDLSAHSLGALISYYENTVLFEGLLWGINSFDQPGIELGKKLLKDAFNPLFQQLKAQLEKY